VINSNGKKGKIMENLNSETHLEGNTFMEADLLKTELPKKRIKKVGVIAPVESDLEEGKDTAVRITFEGEAAKRILRCETELKERLSKPDLGKVLGKEILSWSEKRWAEIVEENTDMEYFFAQIRKSKDRAKSIKLLKSLAERLKSEESEASSLLEEPTEGVLKN
jgi:hypothetical protein